VATTEDYKKYHCARGARGVRRLAAKIQASDIDPELIAVLMEDLVEIIQCQRTVALAGWPFPDDVEEVEIDFFAYSDGRPVSTTVPSGDGYATIMNHPDALETSDTTALLPEHWPCGHRQAPPWTEPGD
jgi:hypothetical protein